MKIHRLLLIFICFILAFFISEKLENEPTENLFIEPGVGFDIVENLQKEIDYKIIISSYVFKGNNEVTSEEYTTLGPTISINREKRQLMGNKRFIVGFEKVYVISEEYGRYGIKNSLDILQKNPWVNDNGNMIICKGNAEDIMKLKIKGYPSSSDFIDGLISSSRSNNFFIGKYALINILQQVETEGKNSTLPYIEFKDDKLQITGMAIFNKDKMISKIDRDEAKILNILREDKVKGIWEIQEKSNKYISFESIVKKKVKCYKEGEKFKFVIDLNFNGEVISNQLYNGIAYDENVKKKFEEDMAEKIKKMCYEFINKMQNQYKIDMLNLGSIATSKYGRHSGYDWNEKVSKAEIEVNIKVNVDKNGRGDY